jgi:hypothetical protein
MVGAGYRFHWGDVTLAFRNITYQRSGDVFLQKARPTGPEPRCAGKAQETTSRFFQRAAQAYIWSLRVVNVCVSIVIRMDNTSWSRSSMSPYNSQLICRSS